MIDNARRSVRLALIMMFAASPLFAAFSGEMRLLNQQLDNNVLTVDIYLKSTGDDPLYLSDCNYTFKLNHQKFSDLSVEFTPAEGLLNDRYSYNTSVLEDNTIAIDVFPSSPRASWSLTRFQSRIALISDQGNGSLLGSLRIETLTNFNGYSGLDFRTTFPFFTNINAFDDESPYTSGVAEITFVETPDFALAPMFDVNIKNLKLQGDDVLFDVTMRQTDGPVFYLDDSEIRIQFDAAQFDMPQVDIVELGGENLDQYTVTPSFSDGVLRLKLDAPLTQNQAEMDDMLEVIKRAPSSTEIASLRLRGLKATVGFRQMSLSWASGQNGSSWQRRRPLAPWSIADNISSNAEQSAETPTSTLSLTSPTEAGQYCFEDDISITWESLNVRAVSLQLRPNSGGAPISIFESRAADQTPFTWSVPELAGGTYTLALFDAADASLLALSPAVQLGKAAEITSVSGDQALCLPQNNIATFSLEIEGQPSPSITWQLRSEGGEWTDLAESSTELVLRDRTLGDDGTRVRALIENFCGSATSQEMLLTVKQTPRVLAPPISLDRCTGGNAIFNVEVSGVPEPQLQWQILQNGEFVDLSDETEKSLRLDDIRFEDSGNQYRVELSNECGVVFSDAVTLHVDDPARVTQEPQEVVILCEGDDFSFSAEVAGSPAPALQWEMSSNGGLEWIEMPGQTGLNISGQNVTRDMSQNRYRLRLTQAECVGVVYSRDARIEVNYVPEILLQPKDVTVCENSPTAFSAEADTRPTAQAQWQRKLASESEWSDLGHSGQTLTIASAGPELHGAQYRALFSSACGAAVATRAATLNVDYAPIVTEEPQDAEVCEGGTVSFTAAADARPSATTAWEVSLDDGNSWLQLAEDNVNALEIENVRLSQNGVLYRAVFVNKCTGSKVATRAARINVTAIPKIVRQPFAERALVGQTVILSADVVPNDVNYAWHRNGVPMLNSERISGVKSNRLTINDVQPDDVDSRYQLVIDGECGRDSSQFTSINVDVPGIEIITQPQSAEVCRLSDLMFAVQAQSTINGTQLEYQWRRGTEALQEGGPYSGVNSAVLRITAATEAQAASDYNLQITVQPGGATTFTNNVALTVNTMPQVLSNSADLAVCAGESRILEVDAEGEDLRFQWFFGDDIIDGATEPSLPLDGIQAADAGTYRCVILNDCGAAESADIDVSLKPGVVITLQPQDQFATNESEFTLSVEAQGPGELQYQWFLNGTEIPGAVEARYTKLFPTADDAGEYTVAVRGECDSLLSDVANVNITTVSVDDPRVAQGIIVGLPHPNPAVSHIRLPLQLNRPLVAQLTILDLMGRRQGRPLQIELPAGDHVVSLDCAGLMPGVYYLQLRSAEFNITRGIVRAP